MKNHVINKEIYIPRDLCYDSFNEWKQKTTSKKKGRIYFEHNAVFRSNFSMENSNLEEWKFY